MSDISNNQKNTIGIENITSGYDLLINADGSINVNTVLPPLSPPSSNTVSQLVKEEKMFSVATGINLAAAGTNNPAILIKNPSGSNKTFYLYRSSFGIDIENNYVNYRIYANPTITTNGTTFTPTKNRIGGTINSVMQVYTLPTISSLGLVLQTYEVASNGNSIQTLDDFSLHVLPNNNILVTGDPKSNNRLGIITISWAEF